MDINNLKNIFRNFTNGYDVNDINIRRKIDHSYRVMDICGDMATYYDFNEEDKEIAILIGLLHDYARFDQWTMYNTYNDKISIDHGDLAIKRLFDDNEIVNYCTNKDYYDIIYKAIKYHNKYDYPSDLSEKEKMFCNLIRDADKLDIFYQLGVDKNLFKEDDNDISDKIKETFYKEEQINYDLVNGLNDKIILSLAMVYDLNFDYSYKYIDDNNLIAGMYNNIDDKNKFYEYFDYVKNYIEKRS